MIRRATPRALAWPVDPRNSEGKIAWSSATHDAAKQCDVHCSVGHRYYHYKLLSRELKLTYASSMRGALCMHGFNALMVLFANFHPSVVFALKGVSPCMSYDFMYAQTAFLEIAQMNCDASWCLCHLLLLGDGRKVRIQGPNTIRHGN